MKLIILAEHFDPLIGGATHLTKQIVAGITEQGHEVTLIVPNSGTEANERDEETYPYTLVKIGVGVDLRDRNGFKRGKRKDFALAVDAYLKEIPDAELPPVIQIMTGMYLLRYLDVPYFHSKGVKLVANVLNIPPQETALSWKGDKLVPYIKDQIRRYLVKVINAKRIYYHDFDAYTVISDHTKNLMAPVLKNKSIKVIPLGCEFTGFIPQEKPEKFPNRTLRILTGAGINPSKNQHIIPEISAKLEKAGIDFIWHVIGPDRNTRYTAYFKQQIQKHKQQDRIEFIPGVPKAELMTYYEKADIFVQTSLEEGFCMTALDSILYGLPLVGAVTGAIPEFIEKGNGVLVENNVEGFFQGIMKVIANPSQYGIAGEAAVKEIADTYTWEENARAYIETFQQISQQYEPA